MYQDTIGVHYEHHSTLSIQTDITKIYTVYTRRYGHGYLVIVVDRTTETCMQRFTDDFSKVEEISEALALAMQILK